MFGPFVENNKHNADELIKSGLGIQVNNADEIEVSVKSWLSSEGEHVKLEEKAKNFVSYHQGASQRMANLIESQLKN